MTDFVKEVEKLMQLPKGYCKACGKCCEIATARNCLTYEELLKVAKGETNAPLDVVISANDFLETFVPFENRPTFCRKYPVVDKRTFFFEGCGLEKVVKENIKKVDEIINYLEQKEKNNGQ